MADELIHGAICGDTWWSNSCTSRNMFGSPSLCSSSTITDLGGAFGWSNIDMFDDMKSTATLTRSTDESLFLHQDVQNFDESLDSTTTSEWKEAFLQTNRISQGSYPIMIQEDFNSGMNNYHHQQQDAIMEFCPKTYASDQESSNNTTFKQPMNSDFTSTCEELPTNYPLNPSPSCVYSSTFLQNLFSDDTLSIQKPLFENHQSTFSIDNDFMSNNLNGFSIVNQPPLAFSNNTSSTQLQAPSSSISEEFNRSKATIQAKIEEHGAKKTNDVSAFKRPRIETPSSLPTFKVRKEKLGDRITAIQQLVSPFGKTDTASVLHEAIEYIKFLHDQVNVLSTPYMKNRPLCQREQQGTKEQEQDLKSRGLCLVPLSSTFSLAAEPPTDFWTPTVGGAFRNDKWEAWNGGSHIALACKF